MTDLYQNDVLLWSQQQGELLRRRAAGELVNEADLDWPNIAEEIESVGRSQLSAVRSHIVLALLHDLKVQAWPLSRDAAHWRAEAIGFRQEAAEAFTPSMRQHLDMSALYARALRRLPESVDGRPPLPVPRDCPLGLDELMAAEA